MAPIRTLDWPDQLRHSGFGQPPPRHGLELLYWFATECVSFNVNNTMLWRCDPKTGQFGFHLYQNRSDNNGKKLLPDAYKPYYTVGNLNAYRAHELPDRVRRRNTTYQDGSNKDRVIISMTFDKVYVTEHRDRTNFNQRATYEISTGLLRRINKMTRREFMRAMNCYYDDSEESDASETAHLIDDQSDDARVSQTTGESYWILDDEEEELPRRRRCLDCCTIL